MVDVLADAVVTVDWLDVVPVDDDGVGMLICCDGAAGAALVASSCGVVHGLGRSKPCLPAYSPGVVSIGDGGFADTCCGSMGTVGADDCCCGTYCGADALGQATTSGIEDNY